MQRLRFARLSVNAKAKKGAQKANITASGIYALWDMAITHHHSIAAGTS
jgi:hypothetical protein